MVNIFLLDVDDTVFDFPKTAYKALEYTCKKMKIPFDDEVFSIYMQVNSSAWARFERKEIDRQQLLDIRFGEFFEKMGIQKDPAKANKLYFKKLGNFVFYLDGAENFVQKLQAMGDIYLATNGISKAQHERIAKSGIMNYAKGMFVSGDIGANKPSKEYFYYCFSQIKDFDKERAIMIGDSLTSDIKGANESGIKSIWYNAKNKELTDVSKPDYVAKSYNEIIKIIKDINKSGL